KFPYSDGYRLQWRKIVRQTCERSPPSHVSCQDVQASSQAAWQVPPHHQVGQENLLRHFLPYLEYHPHHCQSQVSGLPSLLQLRAPILQRSKGARTGMLCASILQAPPATSHPQTVLVRLSRAV